MNPIVEKLRACADDPMWADHAEIPKAWCREAADEIERLNAALAAEKVRADAAEADMRTAIRAANGVASRLETELATSEAAREKAEAALREARDELALAEEVPSFTEEQRRGCIARALVAIRAALKPTGATP